MSEILCGFKHSQNRICIQNVQLSDYVRSEENSENTLAANVDAVLTELIIKELFHDSQPRNVLDLFK